MVKFDERVLPDDYPVYAGYVYVIDGKPRMSDISGTVRQLKGYMNANEVMNCDLYARSEEMNGQEN